MGVAEIIKSVLPLATAGAYVRCCLFQSAILLVIVQILTQCYIGIWCWISSWWNAWDGTFWCFKPCSILSIKNILLDPATWDRSDTVVVVFTKITSLYTTLTSECHSSFTVGTHGVGTTSISLADTWHLSGKVRYAWKCYNVCSLRQFILPLEIPTYLIRIKVSITWDILTKKWVCNEAVKNWNITFIWQSNFIS